MKVILNKVVAQGAELNLLIIKQLFFIILFVGFSLSATNANAIACTSAATGNWSAAATWVAPCNIVGGPVAADTVTIAAAHTVTVTANAAATSIAVQAPTTTNGVTLGAGVTLTVSGAITMAAPAGNNRTLTFAVGTGTLNAGSIAISGGTGATRISQLTVGATGVVNVTGAVTTAGTAAQSRFIATGASTIIVGGNFAPGAFTPGGSTLTISGNFNPTAMVASTGTVIFAGSAAQTMRVLTTYNNVTVNNTAVAPAGVSLLGTTTIGGALTVNSGIFSVGTRALTVTGATSLSDTLSATTGATTFVGAVTVNPGGVWAKTTGAATFRGGLTHNGATFTAGTGIYTFNTTAAQSINCATALTIPRLTVTSPTVLTNSCNLTVSTALAGTGNFTNGASGTLNIAGTSSITTLANAGTLNKTGAGAMTSPLATFTNTGTVNLNGTGTMTGLTNSGIVNLATSGTITALTNAATGTLSISAATVPTITTLTATAVGNTVNYTGTGQTLKVTAYHHLSLSGGAKTFGAITTVAGNLTLSGTATATAGANLTIGGNLDIGTGTTFANGANALNVAGNFVQNGTFTAGAGVVTLNGGTVVQTISGTGTLGFANLTVSNTGGITLARNVTVTSAIIGTVSLTSTCPTDYTLTSNGGLTVAHSCPAPAVVSITMASANPTTAASVSWTVTFNVSMTGVASGNFTLVNTGLGGSPAITGVSGSGITWTVTASTGTDTGTLGLDMVNTVSVSPALTNLPFTGDVYSVRPLTPVIYYHDTTLGVAIGVDGPTNVVSGTNMTIPPIITASLTTVNTCTGNARSNSHPIGLYTHSRWYLTTDYANATNIGANPVGSAFLRGNAATDSVVVSLYDYDPVSGAKALIGSSPAITLTGGATTTAYAYTISSSLHTVPAGHRLMLQYDFNQPAANNNARVYCSSASAYIAVIETPASPPTCFADTFTGVDNTSPGTNWSVGNKSGAFGNPVIFGNRLRLSNATTGVATWATLQRMIPAAGNKVTLEFDHFAYGGTHADGIGVILSDASVAPQAGAFGGSLGYAQKGYTPISDCATVGGCPGFAGGWLGIGIDEYGNYSTSTEGRNGGSAAAIVNSVAIRGSGSGMSGYRFLQGTTTLSPTVDSVAVLIPPHRYRIVVDHVDGLHAWTSVERDITGGGTAYTTLIGCPPGVTSGCTALDVKDPGYSQSAVPASWNLSLTGSTGALTNIHEIDNLSICTVQGLATPSLHHIKIEHGGAACTNSPATLIVKACADAACSSLYLNSVTVALSSAPGGTWAPASPITFSGGQVAVTLTDATVRTDTLGATATAPTAAYATQCFNGATQTCSLSFATCSFDVIEVAAAANTPIFTKLASSAFNLDVLKLSAGNQSVTAVALVDASSGACSTYALLANTSTALPSAFSNAVPRKSFSFTYANAAPNVRVRVTTAGPNYSCSSDNFAIRPQAYTVTSSATQAGSTGTPVFRAGMDTFSLIATAATNLYTGAPKFNSSLVTTNLANLGALISVSFPAATGGISTANGFTYSEVGNFGLSQYALYDDTFAQVDSVKGECTSGFSNTADANGKYSCQFGSAAAGPFGRFVPDHFTVVGDISNACVAGAVTYMDQPVPLSSANVVEARNSANGVTKNYVPPYAPGIVSLGAENADNGTDLSARIAFPAGNWISGVYTLASASATFNRPVIMLPDSTWGSFESLDVGLTVTNGDLSTVLAVSGADMNPAAAGGSSFTYKKFAGSPLRMRFGRLKLSNVVGSELLDLTMPMEAQYWNGTAWIRNDLDSCTNLTPVNVKSSNAIVTINSVTPVSGKAGLWNITLGAPAVQVTSDVCVDLSTNDAACSATSVADKAYLQAGASYTQDPTARAIFGVYQGRKQFIYMRENY